MGLIDKLNYIQYIYGTCLHAGIDALLSTLRSLNEKVGTYDEEEEFQMLEQLLQSSQFKKAKDVSVVFNDVTS